MWNSGIVRYVSGLSARLEFLGYPVDLFKEVSEDIALVASRLIDDQMSDQSMVYAYDRYMRLTGLAYLLVVSGVEGERDFVEQAASENRDLFVKSLGFGTSNNY